MSHPNEPDCTMADMLNILELDNTGTPKLSRKTLLDGVKKKKTFNLNFKKQQRRPEDMQRKVFGLLDNKPDSTMVDIRDILELGSTGTPELSRKTFLGDDKQKKTFNLNVTKPQKRPEGMNREVFALLDNKDLPPIFPTDTGNGYKSLKAKFGMKKARPWKWTAFKNPARNDDMIFHHWRRAGDEAKEYSFAKFNKQVNILSYTEEEYNAHLCEEGWSQEETDHLFELAKRFDLRFIIMQDRWGKQFPTRSVEDLKERYYKICGILGKLQGEKKIYTYDAERERRRKEQLERLYERTPEQIEEEQYLLNERRKIELRRKERERRTQELQTLIDEPKKSSKKTDKKLIKKKLKNPPKPSRVDTCQISQPVERVGIKFPEIKGTGVSLRSRRIKLPANVGKKKLKAIDQMLEDLEIDLYPIPTEEICKDFNELRSDIVLLYELKNTLTSCQFEQQILQHQFEALHQGGKIVKADNKQDPSDKSAYNTEPSLVQLLS